MNIHQAQIDLDARKASITYGWKGEEGDAEERAARGDYLARPGDGHSVAVADGAQRYLRVGRKVD